MPLHSQARRCLLLCATIASLATMAVPSRAADREPLDLQKFRGKVVLLDFWASWCTPCLESFPWMQRIQQEYANRGLVVVAVNVDHDRQLAERFLKAQEADFPIIFDPQGRLAERFHVQSMPASFYIDRNGEIRHTHAGFRSGDRGDAEHQLAALVAEH